MASPGEKRIQTVCLLILSGIALSWGLYIMKSVMIPFIIAVFLYFLLMPLVQRLKKHLKLPQPVAVILTLLMVFILINLVLGLVISSISPNKSSDNKTTSQTIADPNDIMADQLGEYIQRVEVFATKIIDKMPNSVRKFIYQNADEKAMRAQIEKVVGMVSNNSIKFLVNLSGVLQTILSQTLLITIFLLFLLLGAKPHHRPESSVLAQAESKVKRFVITKILTSAATGILVGLILSLLGIKYALVFGLFAFLLNFIPSIGSMIATLLPIPVVFFTDDVSVAAGIAAIILPGLVQLGIGNGIEPKIMGNALDLHPVVILLALIFWGVLWGIVGMLLATPISAIIKIIFERIEVTQPLANLMAGKLDLLEKESLNPS